MTPRWRPWLLTAPIWLAVGGSLSLGGCGAAERAPQSTFRLLDGSTLTSADLAGRVLLVNFWATTCVSCVKEMPQLVELRTLERAGRRHTPVIMVTAYDLPEDRRRLLDAGADGYVAKPLDAERLAAELARVVP